MHDRPDTTGMKNGTQNEKWETRKRETQNGKQERVKRRKNKANGKRKMQNGKQEMQNVNVLLGHRTIYTWDAVIVVHVAWVKGPN